MSFYQECPRCGSVSYERLSTHAYCVDCNYSPELETKFDEDCLPIPPWAEKAVKEMEKAKKKKMEPEIQIEVKGNPAA